MKTNIYKEMVELQHQFNKQVDENYLEKNWNWNSAIIVESGELLESLGFKWWKKQKADMDNVKVEAIDLLHFVISETIQRYYQCDYKSILDDVADEFRDYFQEVENYIDFECTDLEELISFLNYDEYDRLFIMKQIFKTLNMSNEDVYIAYIVKNCLNKFRADNGYKDGTYIKIWNGKEDNIFAYELAIDLINSDSGLSIFDDLYSHLKLNYGVLNGG